MSDALTRTQFALDALVAAGHVSQAKVDEALALFPAPAGEPEMPVNAAYWWSPKDGAMAGTWSSNTGPHPDWDVTHYFTADQLRAYGDARAEHARRVAMEENSALAPDAARYQWLRGSDWEMFDSRWLIEIDIYGQGPADMDAAIDDAIRAAAPQRGETR